MKNSNYWIGHFKANALEKRVNWALKPNIIPAEICAILSSLQAWQNATGCDLLKQICTDILVDEAYHITFQTERLTIIYDGKNNFSKGWRKIAYRYFFYATSSLVWFAHRKLFKAGGNTFDCYTRKMEHKFLRTLKKITHSAQIQLV